MSDEANHGLTADELAAAGAFGMSPQDYADYKAVRNVHEYEALQRRRAEDTEHERLKAAVREALAERDNAA